MIRLTQLTVLPEGSDIFAESATKIEITDEGGGEFVTISQEVDERVELRFDFTEWGEIDTAVRRLIGGGDL